MARSYRQSPDAATKADLGREDRVQAQHDQRSAAEIRHAIGLGAFNRYRTAAIKSEPIAVNQLGDQALGSTTICGSRNYVRVDEQVDGRRQEMLYCLAGEK